MSKSIETLRQDHKNMWQLLDVIEQEFRRFESGETLDYDLMIGALSYCLHYPTQFHHPAEEAILRALTERVPRVALTVDDLAEEHEKLDAMTRKLAESVQSVLSEMQVSKSRLVEMADTFVAAYRAHIKREEDSFFNDAESILRDGDWQRIDQEVADLEDPLTAGDANGYLDLRKTLVRWSKENQRAAG